MIYIGITPIHKMGDIYVKREDLAYWNTLEYPSGSKVRQYLNMAHRVCTREGYPPCLVGCSANSAQQIYVAATAKILNTKSIIYTAKRNLRTDATRYAAYMGAEINEVRPAYLSYVRVQARNRATLLKQYVQWDQAGAITDAANQVVNPPKEIKRIVVPTGSGLTAIGILKGLHSLFGSDWTGPTLVIVATSTMASLPKIKKSAGVTDYPVDFIEPDTPYDTPIIERLPDGTPLDPFYSAKAYKYLQPHDLFWPPGLRPVISMPKECQDEFKDWKGPDTQMSVVQST